MKNESNDVTYVPARFPIKLNLPPGKSSHLADVQEAIKREFRDSVKWKRLRCRRVEVLSETETGTIFVLHIGHSVEFDWTWEGAVAFRPLVMQEVLQEQKRLFDQQGDEPEIDDSILWRGEILEVDEATGRIFLCVADPEHPPRKGSFYVRPFEFLSFLNAIFHEPAFDRVRPLLPDRLLASEGNVHPDANDYLPVGVSHLSDWWRTSWSILWGPPGTGKTYNTGHQVAKPTRLLLSYTPGGFEQWFLDIGKPAADTDKSSPPITAEDIKRAIVAAEKYGVKFEKK